MYTHIYIYICISMCMYIYIYTHVCMCILYICILGTRTGAWGGARGCVCPGAHMLKASVGGATAHRSLRRHDVARVPLVAFTIRAPDCAPVPVEAEATAASFCGDHQLIRSPTSGPYHLLAEPLLFSAPLPASLSLCVFDARRGRSSLHVVFLVATVGLLCIILFCSCAA